MSTERINLLIENEIATLTLGRAHCVDQTGKQELTKILIELREHRDPIRSLVICATHPLAWLVDVQELATMQPAEARIFSRHGHELASAIADLPFPVIAAVDAPALGGGCELVLACDLALAGEQAKFGQIEALGGVMPAFGGTWRLEERVGYQRALAMMFTGEVADADSAKRYGIVLDIYPSARLLEAAKALAQRIAGASVHSIAAIKRVTRAGRGLPAAALNALEEETFPSLFGPEQQERMKAFLQQQSR
jgi:enoyl-CoA hydratase